MAGDDTAAQVRHFDNWYGAMAGSPRRDEIVQRHLGLPPSLLSGSLLPWDGIAEVVELLRLEVPATLVDLACGRELAAHGFLEGAGVREGDAEAGGAGSMRSG